MKNKAITFKNVKIISSATVGGKLEGNGPIKKDFDYICEDGKFGMDTWEKAEAEMIRTCSDFALKKAKLSADQIDFIFAGDLTNQCVSTAFGLKDQNIPYVGLYGACSTFALSLGLAGMTIEGNFANHCFCLASSHFCTAERQYRFPLEYGCQRTPTSQTTVTAAGCAILAKSEEECVTLTEFLPGIIYDLGVTDESNMGAAMAPACANTLLRYFENNETRPEQFDLILSGDLGFEGHRLTKELCKKNNLSLGTNFLDCGMIIYDSKNQEINQGGGSGCGCSASVFSGHIMNLFKKKELKDVLLIGTGALLSANTVLQKESIPGIAHLIRLQGA